ncbi:winged helix-turn-helix domain-containing protein [Blochmannia endosymbiont of Camponotus sp.]|uniref:winged helix-turn-helix domain-containing protein n=1 Tax=Blochmannia endosymbiont of Camponotus sp. TaxID=700220 RepID=UPI002024780E|nr:transcriptional regulator [Blochmannia endosymbiont of Camponotus sp.]URJ32508.1 transcriptional regulator [Blochmannia endosymbiont of Camponotus sp.]
MKYVIQSTIIFDTTEYTLTLLTDSDTSVKLSNSAGRVLEELIKRHNIDVCAPVTREHLFSNVWRAYGLEPSNGNLNQQISVIRKTLTSFGLDSSSIITIPKRGLKLNNQLIIEKIHEDRPCVSPSLHKNTDQNNNLLSSSILLNIKAHIKYMITLTIMVVILLSIGFVYLYTKKDHIKLYCCKEINSCNICTFHSELGFECNDCTMQCTEIT